METQPASVVSAQGLTKRYGKVVAVDDLSFELAAGTITGFIGPNGAGKTTTMHMLLDLVEPTRGSARIAGARYRDLPDPKRTVGAVLDSAGFHPGRTARQHLRILAAAAGLPAGDVDGVLERVGLTDAADRRAGGFSTGMRQRLHLAGALLGDPEVLVLDEPNNGLDPEGIRWLRAQLRRMADEGRTVLISSHGLAELAQSISHAIVIARGRLVAAGTLDEVMRAGGSANLEESYLNLVTGGGAALEAGRMP